jgi:hypothetical protein
MIFDVKEDLKMSRRDMNNLKTELKRVKDEKFK